jgi:cleavage and polyadenylation specificity factor subunit 1
MAEVPKGLNLDYDLPMRKIPLKRTASAITYHPETMTFVISTSVSDSFRYDRESDTMDNAAARASRFPPIIEVYKLELFSPKTWGTIDVFDLNQNEHVICLRSVSLSTSQTSSGRKSFVVVGTGINRGEDTMVRGRILVFDIIDVVPEPGRPETNFKMKLLFEKEGKGAITAISSCNGFLATATGNQLFISEFTNDDTLTKIAFFNLETYCISLNSVKNYLLMGDVYKGAWFLAYQVK